VAIEEKSLKSMTKRNKKEEKRHNTSCWSANRRGFSEVA
jgi:hypothetical protein